MRDEERKEKTKLKRPVKILITLAIIVGALAAAFAVAWNVFVLKTINVVGNQIYSGEQIANWVMQDENSWNTLYLVFKDRFQKQDEIPFLDSMEIHLVSPTEIEVDVTEKGVLGYIYIPSQGENAYFDQDGFVVELSNDSVRSVTKITGLDVESATLYEKLDLEDSSILKTLYSLTQLLKKHELEPEIVYIQGNRIILSYGNIQVNLGTGTQLNEKILRMKQILPQLEGKRGTLHMEGWSVPNKDVYFTPGELTSIPSDTQTVPAESDTSQEQTTVQEPEVVVEEPEVVEEEQSETGESDYDWDYYEDDYDTGEEEWYYDEDYSDSEDTDSYYNGGYSVSEWKEIYGLGDDQYYDEYGYDDENGEYHTWGE